METWVSICIDTELFRGEGNSYHQRIYRARENMDQWVQKLSAIIILLTIGASLHCSRLGATCWCPAVFSRSHVRYTDAWCSSNASKHHPPLPPSGPDTLVDRSVNMVKFFGDNTSLFKYLSGELILVCALYSLIKCIVSSSTLDVLFSNNIHRSYSKVPVYIIVQLAGCFVWALFAVLTFRSYSPDLLAKPEEPFMCDFEIRQMGRVQKYTVQCVDETEEGMKMAVMTNVALCVVVAFSKLVHLVAVFGIQPLLKVDKVAAKMVNQNVIADSNEISLGFGLSDLYFAILVSERDITPFIKMKQVHDERNEKYPYGSRPTSIAF